MLKLYLYSLLLVNKKRSYIPRTLESPEACTVVYSVKLLTLLKFSFF